MKARQLFAIVPAIAALALAGCLEAPSRTAQGAGQSPAAEMQPAISIDAAPNIESLRELDRTFADIAEFASEAVVHIQAQNVDADPRAMFMGGQPSGGIGSGFIYRADGWIITNDHVVAGFDSVTVFLKDGREFEGEVRRSADVASDLAVIKIDATGLPTLEFADSSTVRPGQFAIAIGSPFGFDQTVTVGHISGIGRQGAVIDQRTGMQRGYSGMIQTDASINPGNSGGPLINIDGRVVGINTTIYSESGGNQGIGFAIPSRQARIVADTLIRDGKLNRGFLGITPVDLKPYQAQEMGVEAGALVAQVVADTPAANAGLQQNDVITQIADMEIKSELDLRIAMFQHAPGTQIEIQYVRDGNVRNARLEVGALPDEIAMNTQPQIGNVPPEIEDFFNDRQRSEQGGPARLGVTVGPIDSSAQRQFNIPSDARGVVVTVVVPDSTAARAGIEVGDVIVSLDGQAITEPTQLAEVVSGYSRGDRAQLEWRRYDDGAVSTISQTVRF